MVELIISAVVLLAVLGLVTYLWTSAQASETRAREERDLREKTQQVTAAVERELEEARRQLAIERAAVLRIQARSDQLQRERDAARIELAKLVPGNQRLKSTLVGGVWCVPFAWRCS